MREHNPGKIDREGWFILTNGKVEMEVPADRCSVGRIIGTHIEGRTGACHETQYIDMSCCMMSDPKWLDGEGKETDKGTAGKAGTLSVQYKSNKAGDKITFHIYREGSDIKVGTAANIDANGNGERQEIKAEWSYEYKEVRDKEGEPEPYQEKPKYYFTAKNEDGYTLQHDKLLEMGMEINLVVVDDDDVIIRGAPVEIKFKAEQKDEQGNPIDNPLRGKSDAHGVFKKTDLIPDEIEVTVNMPIERSYPLDSSSGKLITYPKDLSQSNNNDHLVEKLNQIDGSEIIQNGSSGQNPIPPDKLDLGKTNIIKLPVRYLDNSNKYISVPTRNQMSECEFIEYILGNSYHNAPVNINRIQIYKGLPSPKQLKELINYYQVSLTDSRFSTVISSEQNIRNMMTGTPAISLPNGIIYIPFIGGAPYDKAVFVHEAFHQFQYIHGELNNIDIFKGLVQEMWDNKNNQNYNSYAYLSHAGQNVSSVTNIQSLEQITTLEGRARFMEDFVRTVCGQGQISLSDFKPALDTNKSTSGINTRVIL
jgi:hypothetical protein